MYTKVYNEMTHIAASGAYDIYHYSLCSQVGK